MNNIIMSIVVIVLLLAVLAWLWYHGKQKWVAKILLGLVTEAETMYGSKTGPIKYAVVVSRVYPQLPLIMRLFMTEEKLGNMIDASIDWLEDKLGGMTMDQYIRANNAMLPPNSVTTE